MAPIGYAPAAPESIAFQFNRPEFSGRPCLESAPRKGVGCPTLSVAYRTDTARTGFAQWRMRTFTFEQSDTAYFADFVVYGVGATALAVLLAIHAPQALN